eukprot:CAMPEP_0115516360 /NCGR_PEP_ID=MMETSP0271-20121206/76722_1 /TAXON_ID=71861 /ORGANISM="Scrippsiella trochoidea, Strain CCMP3099" /LENGTH=54 /DNA_ID=CAMNT_0002947021 /DNA_START=87 /DNA_END=248 /DNA_ORIENTATION=-
MLTDVDKFEAGRSERDEATSLPAPLPRISCRASVPEPAIKDLLCALPEMSLEQS